MTLARGLPAFSPWPLIGFLSGYALVEVCLYFAIRGNTLALSIVPILLTVLLLSLVVAGVFVEEPAKRRFYLAAASLPVFAFVRLALSGSVVPLAETLLAYFLLGLTLLLFQVATGARVRAVGLRPRDILAGLRLAVPLGVLLAVFGRLFLPTGTPYEAEDPWLVILVVGSVAFWDEYWFRGVLQSQIASAYSPITGWWSAAVLFVAFDGSSGNPVTLLFRAALAVLLGYIVFRRRALPIALAVRVTFAVSLVILASLS